MSLPIDQHGEQKEEAVQLLKAQLETQQRLLAAVVHELQSGLQALIVQADSLIREASSEKPNLRRIKESGKDILVFAEMMTAMTNNLRRGPAPRTAVPFNASKTVRKVVELLSAKAQSMGIDVLIGGDEASLMVTASEPLLQQVVYNLVDNAIKYSHRTSGQTATIKVILRQIKNKMEIEVQNFGLPIEPEEAQKIFEAGYRGRASVQRSPLGTGLGLFVSKKALEEQGGSLEIRTQQVSESGKALIRAIARLPLETSVA